MLSLLRDNEGFIMRSQEMLDTLSKLDTVPLSIYRLHRGLEIVSAATLLENHSVAKAYFQRYAEDWKSFVSDKKFAESQLSYREYDQADTAATIYVAVCNGIYVSIASNFRSEIEEIISDLTHRSANT